MGIGVIKELLKILERKALPTIYKSFVRLYQDYDGIVYDRPDKGSIIYNRPWSTPFISKLEQVHYAVLAISGAIKCTSRTKLCKELGLESLESRRLKHLCFLNKIISNGLPAYLDELIPKKSHQ